MKPVIHNLDEKLRDPEYIIIGGEKIDISFIPCGLSIPILQLYDEFIQEAKKSGMDENNFEFAQANFERLIKILSTFTKFFKDELDEVWIMRNLSLDKVYLAIQKLIETITSGYKKTVDDNKKKVVLDGKK